MPEKKPLPRTKRAAKAAAKKQIGEKTPETRKRVAARRPPQAPQTTKDTAEVVHDALSTVFARPDGERALAEALQMRELAKWCVDTRLDQGLTQAEVAKRMGTNQVAVSRFENAVVPDPTLGFISGYARALGHVVDFNINPPGPLEIEDPDAMAEDRTDYERAMDDAAGAED